MCALVKIEPVSRFLVQNFAVNRFQSPKARNRESLKSGILFIFLASFFLLCPLQPFLFLLCSNPKMFKSCFRNHKECILNFAERRQNLELKINSSNTTEKTEVVRNNDDFLFQKVIAIIGTARLKYGDKLITTGLKYRAVLGSTLIMRFEKYDSFLMSYS